jgi:hypothetical protein
MPSYGGKELIFDIFRSFGQCVFDEKNIRTGARSDFWPARYLLVCELHRKFLENYTPPLTNKNRIKPKLVIKSLVSNSTCEQPCQKTESRTRVVLDYFIFSYLIGYSITTIYYTQAYTQVSYSSNISLVHLKTYLMKLWPDNTSHHLKYINWLLLSIIHEKFNAAYIYERKQLEYEDDQRSYQGRTSLAH